MFYNCSNEFLKKNKWPGDRKGIIQNAQQLQAVRVIWESLGSYLLEVADPHVFLILLQ